MRPTGIRFPSGEAVVGAGVSRSTIGDGGAVGSTTTGDGGAVVKSEMTMISTCAWTEVSLRESARGRC